MNKSKRKFAFDAETDGPSDASALVDEGGSPICDSGQAHRVLVACIDRLNRDDFDRVVGMLKDADMIDADEERAITAGLSGDGGKTGEPDMASDEAIMSRRRRQVAEGLRPTSCLRDPIHREPSAEDIKRRNEMFPHHARLL